jgi:hypothetical protein
LYPHWPNSAIGWAILIFIGIPLSIALEALFEFAFSEKIGKSITDKRFSGLRIIIALVFALFVLGTFALILWFFAPHVRQYFA